jgi:hypothetical protein
VGGPEHLGPQPTPWPTAAPGGAGGGGGALHRPLQTYMAHLLEMTETVEIRPFKGMILLG